jgi:hypothetical protein
MTWVHALCGGTRAIRLHSRTHCSGRRSGFNG